MSIRYEPVFEYRDSEAANLQRGLSVLAQWVNGSSMSVVRKVVCAHANGSYSLLSELLSYKDQEYIRLSRHQAEMLLGVAGAFAETMTPTETRKLRTWLGCLIKDTKEAAAREKREEQSGKSGSMANAS